jgi:hypothetical protein
VTLQSVDERIGGRNVTAVCLPLQAPMARDLLAALASIAAHTALHPGSRVRFGWSVLTLEEDGAGGLTVCEPDFLGDPLRQVRPRVDVTLEVLSQQTAFVRRIGVDPVDAGFDQFVVVARDADATASWQLFRGPPSSDEDSGWSISAAGAPPHDEDEETLEGRRVHTFLRTRPAVLAAVVLPAGFAVLVDGNRITAALDPEGRDRLSGTVWEPRWQTLHQR